MPRENTSRYAVLGMLTRGPRTGYDIRREIGLSVRHFWSESYGQVYPGLKELVRDGLATVEAAGGDGRPERKLYTLTDAGLAELRRWLGKPVVPQPSRNELLLKLFFGRYADPDQLVAVVERARARQADAIAEYEAIVARLHASADAFTPSDLRDRLFTLRYGMVVGEAALRWLDETLAALRAGDGSTGDGGDATAAAVVDRTCRAGGQSPANADDREE